MPSRCPGLLLLLLLDRERAAALVVGSALHVQPATSMPCRAHAPVQMSAMIPSTAGKAAVAAVTAFGLWFRRIRSVNAAKDEFTNMVWADAPTDEELEAESCTVLGEDKTSGRVWYRCFDKSEGLDCEPDASVGADSFVCKEPSK